MKKLVLFVTVINIVFLFSCKKEEELSNTELLCRAPWILSASVIDPPYFIEGLGSITDYYALLSPCYKDNLWNFSENGKYTFEDGPTKCDVLDPAILDYGDWSFNSAETVIIVDNGYYIIEYNIIELTKQTLQVSSMIADTLSNIYTWTETYTHK
jgi:hypothetical protein